MAAPDVAAPVPQASIPTPANPFAPPRVPSISGVQLVAHSIVEPVVLPPVVAPPPVMVAPPPVMVAPAPAPAPMVTPAPAPAPMVALPKTNSLPVLSIPPFDGAAKRRRGIIVVVTALLLVVGAFVATTILSQMAH